MNYGAVVTLKIHPSWLALDRETRNSKAMAMLSIISQYDDVDVDWFDADALGTGYSDWVLCRFDSLDRYHSLWEELKDLEFFFHPYAEIVQSIIGLHNGFERYEAGEL